MHRKQIVRAGTDLKDASKSVILLHGRGATTADILSLSAHLNVQGYALLAPQATNNTWYPFSFLSPVSQNEPWLSSALAMINELVEEVVKTGIERKHLYFVGFSQGACLMLEFLARNASQYGGAAAFTGGVIGDIIHPEKYVGDFMQTPFFLGCSDHDPHVPLHRVYATGNILRDLNASVTEKIYADLEHSINQDEIDRVNQIIFH